jgi:hypothetical protein
MDIVNRYAIAAVLCLQALCTCLSSTIGQYIYAYYLRVYPSPASNNTSNSSTRLSFDFIEPNNANTTKCIKSDLFSFDNDAQTWAQQRSADLFFRTNLYSCCPLIVMTYILGLYVAKFGRRFVLLLPMLGIVIQFSIWLSIIYLHLSDYWWYIAAVIVGLSGSNGIISRCLHHCCLCKRYRYHNQSFSFHSEFNYYG